MTFQDQLAELRKEAENDMGFLKAVHSTSGKRPFDRMMDYFTRATQIGGALVNDAVARVNRAENSTRQDLEDAARLALAEIMKGN